MPSTPSPQQPVPADPSEGGADGTSAAPTAAVPGRATVSSKRLVLWVAVLAALVILVDQATKIWAVAKLEGEPTIELLGRWLHLTFIRNEGAALGIGSGYTWILTIVVTVVVVFILRSMRKIGSRGWAVALGLLLGGALGNLIDRIFRAPGVAQGHVVDFIGYGDLFIGNVADIAVVGAAVMIAILSIQGIGIDGQRHSGEGEPASAAADQTESGSEESDAAEGPDAPSTRTVS
ncbi:signal peptidase II [Oerskovia enterophila]|uniref:signal peptidase II n=1 Tax=Oerskovia enterophila TaxID=43678 RepID=UPI003396A82A